jgi:membrane-associated phospholipid phosphatase
MDKWLIVWIHAHSSPWLDRVFVLSHFLGDEWFVSILVLGVSAWHLARGERRQALAWLALGLTTVGLLLAVKPWVLRARPALWPAIVVQGGYAFPSGHAIASATFYPLIAHEVAARLPRLSRLAWITAIGLAAFVGIGRIYLGLHWPTDVVAGWALGAAQTTLALAWLRHERPGRQNPKPAPK